MKTNLITNVKQFLFLIIAVLGTFISYSQSSSTITIDGNKTPPGEINDTGGGKSSDGGLLDIGGKDKPLPIPYSLLAKAEYTFAYMEDIGGRGTGGKGTDSGTGQLNKPDDIDPYDIGGRGSSGTGTGMIVYSFESESNSLFSHPSDIGGGGRGTSTDTGQFDDDDYDPYDIGGKNTPGDLGLLALISLAYNPGVGCNFDTEWRDCGSRTFRGDYPANDIGGISSTGTGNFSELISSFSTDF